MDPNRETRIAVMGATGSGKSTFINKASGSNLPVGHGLESCTREVQTSQPFEINSRLVTLIDTPGFDDTTYSDTKILSMIVAYLTRTYEHGTKLAGVIYMHRISDFKMGGTSRRNFKLFRELCGEKSLKNVLIVTTMWSEVTREVGEAREFELKSQDRFFKPVLNKDARMLRHDATVESTHTILRHLINNHPVTLRIQQEIVDEHKPIEQTAAGAELRRALDEQADRHKEEIRDLKAEMEAAMRARDEETRSALQEELEKKRQECLRIEENSQRMATEFAAECARLEARILQMEDEHQKQLQTLTGLLQGEVERSAALEAEQRRQSAAVETAEKERACLEEELTQKEKELEEMKVSHTRKEAESAVAEQAGENARKDLELEGVKEEIDRKRFEDEPLCTREEALKDSEQSACRVEQAYQNEEAEGKDEQGLQEELTNAREQAEVDHEGQSSRPSRLLSTFRVLKAMTWLR